ncbi:hypothetical protein ACQY0O_005562 [Thecaphora frezii]
MRLNSASDGTPMISQWPIEPNRWFEYDIRLADEDVGTYMYHAHVDLQSMTAYGALVIEDALPADQAPPPPKTLDEARAHIRWGDQDLQRLKGKSVPGAFFQYAEDRHLILSDYWANTSPRKLAEGLMADPFVWIGPPSSLLVNGQQKRDCNATAIAASGNPATCPASSPSDPSKPLCDYPEVRVTFDTTYRLRIYGLQSLMYVSMGLLDHTVEQNRLGLIEADGTYLEEKPTTYVETAPGQRYSWLLQTKTRDQVAQDGKSGIYWIRLEPRWRAGPSGWARLVYVDENDQPLGDVQSAQPPAQASNTTALLPKEEMGWITPYLAPLEGHGEPCPPDSAVTRTVVIKGQMNPTNKPGSKGLQWWVNRVPYSEETTTTVPFLVDMYTGQKPRPSLKRAKAKKNPWTDVVKSDVIRADATNVALARKHHLQQLYDDVTGVYLAQPGEVIDIIIINRPSKTANNTEVHPWHMHSAKHWTRATMNGTFSFEAYEAALADTTRFVHPIRRDTTSVYPGPGASYLNQTIEDPAKDDGGWSVLRYRVEEDDAGIYPLHCHIAPHLKMGMAVVFGINIDELTRKGGKLDQVYGEQRDGSLMGLTQGYLEKGKNVAAVV